MAMRLSSGACRPMQAQSTRVAATVVSADCGTLHSVQLTLPVATDDCCADLREFVEAGCGCDADVGRPTTWLILKATGHYVCKVFLALAYPRRRNPFALPVFDQIVGSIIRYFKNRLAKPGVERKVRQLATSPRPFFIALMQRAGDSQLWRHSNYTNETFAADVIENFARHAPEDARYPLTDV